MLSMIKRNIKFPLEFKGGVSVRTLEELKENFDIESIMKYYLDGKLLTWLEQRFYKAELERLKKLRETNQEKVLKELCSVFNIEYIETTEFDEKDFTERLTKQNLVLQYTNNQEIIDRVELVATSQKELEQIVVNLRDKMTRVVYLLGESFDIKDKVENIQYIGINKPKINLIAKAKFDAKAKNIEMQNVILSATEDLKVTLVNPINVEFDKNSKIITVSDYKKQLSNFIVQDNQFDFGDGGFSNTLFRKVFIFENTIVVRNRNIIAFYDVVSKKLINYVRPGYYSFDIKTLKHEDMFYFLDFEEKSLHEYSCILCSVDLRNPNNIKKKKLGFTLSVTEISKFGTLAIRDTKLYLYEINKGANYISSEKGTVQVIVKCVNKENGNLISEDLLKIGSEESKKQGDKWYSLQDNNLYFHFSRDRKLYKMDQKNYSMDFKEYIDAFKVHENKLVGIMGRKYHNGGIDISYANASMFHNMAISQDNIDGAIYIKHKSMYLLTPNKEGNMGNLVIIDMQGKQESIILNPHDGFLNFINVINNRVITASFVKGNEKNPNSLEIKIWNLNSLDLMNTISLPVSMEEFNIYTDFDVDVTDDRLAILFDNQLFVYE